MTMSGMTGLNIRLIGPKWDHDQGYGGISVLCLLVAPVANVIWKHIMGLIIVADL